MLGESLNLPFFKVLNFHFLDNALSPHLDLPSICYVGLVLNCPRRRSAASVARIFRIWGWTLSFLSFPSQQQSDALVLGGPPTHSLSLYLHLVLSLHLCCYLLIRFDDVQEALLLIWVALFKVEMVFVHRVPVWSE